MTPHRILIVDDEESILESYQQIFAKPLNRSRLDDLEMSLFTTTSLAVDKPQFDIKCCRQGDEAVSSVRNALADNKPFSVAFIDVRMPPGPDGVSTAEQIRQLDPHINLVIVTAYSDISPIEISRRVQPPEKLLYVQKPFHTHEIRQFSAALSAKWQLEKDLLESNLSLEKTVRARTSELTLTIEALETTNQKYRKALTSLQNAEIELASRAVDLEGANQALQQMARKDKEAQKELEEKVLFAIHEMVEPYLDKLEQSPLDEYQKSFLKIIKTNLSEISAPFMRDLSQKYFRLSPTELNIANMIKEGLSTKSIGARLKMTKRNVDFHRDRIREKIGIKNTKANLKAVLKELDLGFSNRQD
nr:response regulator transcription factor [Desulfobulbaceae bacterium]